MNTPRTLIDHEATPREMWAYPQFVGWRFVDRGAAKPDKVPVNPRTLGNAGVNWPNSWSTIRAAVATYKANPDLSGVGFVLTPNDPYVMVDLDNCVIDGSLAPYAANIVDRLATYTEFSPSGRGLRLFVRCSQQPAMKRQACEVYSAGRWATLTGNVLHQRPIASHESLDWLLSQFTPKESPQKRVTALLSCSYPIPADDGELWARILKVNRMAYGLYHGDLSVTKPDPITGQYDKSVAVSMLLNCLALWTKGDPARMERMIRQTALDQTKFDQGRKGWTWLDGRIQKSIEYMKSQGKL